MIQKVNVKELSNIPPRTDKQLRSARLQSKLQSRPVGGLTCGSQAKLNNYLYSNIGDSQSIGECAEYCNGVKGCGAVVFYGNQYRCDVYGAGAKVKTSRPNGAYDYAIKQ